MKSSTLFTTLLVAAVTTEARTTENTTPSTGLRKALGKEEAHRELRPLRILPNPTTEGAWGHCEGDCDVDNDCYHNLVCFHRQKDKRTAVPGCRGGEDDTSDADFCVFPGDIPRSGNLFEEHIGDHLNDEATPSSGGGLTDTPGGNPNPAEDPDGDTATDPPLQLLQASGVSSSLSEQLITITLVSVVSAALLAIGA